MEKTKVADDLNLSRIQVLEQELKLQEDATERVKTEFLEREKKLQEQLKLNNNQQIVLKEHISGLIHMVRRLEKTNQISETDANLFINKLKQDIDFRKSENNEDREELEIMKDKYLKDITWLRDKNVQLKVESMYIK